MASLPKATYENMAAMDRPKLMTTIPDPGKDAGQFPNDYRKFDGALMTFR
jgi:hypothetical protein